MCSTYKFVLKIVPVLELDPTNLCKKLSNYRSLYVLKHHFLEYFHKTFLFTICLSVIQVNSKNINDHTPKGEMPENKIPKINMYSHS